jgi:RNA polymerase sigma-70 factor (ECF subfamily)
MAQSGGSVRRIRDTVPLTATESFEAFFEDQRPRLFRALLLVTRNAHEAEEILQDAFLKVWERWDRVRTFEDPTGYLYRTAMNGFRSRYRRTLLAARRTVRLAPAEDPFDAVAAREDALRELGRLTPRQRAAVVLTELLGHSYDQAAEELGIKPGTVRVLVSQARRTLKTSEVRDE